MTSVASPRALRITCAIGTILVAVQLAWLVPFILDVNRGTWGPGLTGPLPSAHSCVSAYWTANEAIEQTPDVYAESVASIPQADKTAIRVPRKLGPLNIDAYEYPPTFLLLPRLLTFVAHDFWAFRRVWFVLNFVVVIAAVILVARRLDRANGTGAIWLTPFVIAAPAIIATFQIGNAQLAVIAASMLAMLLFERRSKAAGGLLLAYVTVAKLYPGVLVLFLLLRRDWRAAWWTVGFGSALVAISMAAFGLAPFEAFLDHVPKLMSGEAFPAFRNPAAVGINGSIPGIVFKLGLFGVPGMNFEAMRIVGWLYTLVVIAGTTWLALRVRDDRLAPLVWLAILILATLRSPFLPTYAPFPSMWLATLLAALAWRRGPREAVPAIVCWCVLAIGFGPGGLPPRWSAVWSTLQTGVAFGLLVLAYRENKRKPSRPTLGS